MLASRPETRAQSPCKTSRNQDPLLQLQSSFNLLPPNHPLGDPHAQCQWPQGTSKQARKEDREEMGSERPIRTGCHRASSLWAGPTLSLVPPGPGPCSEPTDTGWAWLDGGISGPPAVMSAWEPELAAWLTDFLCNYFIYTEQEESNSTQADVLKVIICVMLPAPSPSCKEGKEPNGARGEKKKKEKPILSRACAAAQD